MPRYQPVIPACRTGLASRLVPALLALGVALPASAQLPVRDARANTAAVMQQAELIGVMATYDEAKLRADQTAIWAAAKVKQGQMPLQRKPLEELNAAAQAATKRLMAREALRQSILQSRLKAQQILLAAAVGDEAGQKEIREAIRQTEKELKTPFDPVVEATKAVDAKLAEDREAAQRKASGVSVTGTEGRKSPS